MAGLPLLLNRRVVSIGHHDHDPHAAGRGDAPEQIPQGTHRATFAADDLAAIRRVRVHDQRADLLVGRQLGLDAHLIGMIYQR
jgi:hypothetical protein